VNCNDSNCYNSNLAICNKSIYITDDNTEFYYEKITKEIKGIKDNFCIISVNYKIDRDIFGSKSSESGSTTCNIPLRKGKYYLFDYEVPLFCNNKDVDHSVVADKEKICISLKQFPITKYKSNNPYNSIDIKYEVKYKLNYNDPNPIINGYEVSNSFISQYNSSVFCTKGSLEGQNPNYWYCGNFKLIKNILDDSNTIIYKSNIYAKSVFDNLLNYVKTVCSDNEYFKNWQMEIE